MRFYAVLSGALEIRAFCSPFDALVNFPLALLHSHVELPLYSAFCSAERIEGISIHLNLVTKKQQQSRHIDITESDSKFTLQKIPKSNRSSSILKAGQVGLEICNSFQWRQIQIIKGIALTTTIKV